MSCIKSIQRGTDGEVGRVTGAKDIQINAVDPNKAFVIVNSVGYSRTSYDPYDAVGYLTSATTLYLEALKYLPDEARVVTAWQVIEFS